MNNKKRILFRQLVKEEQKITEEKRLNIIEAACQQIGKGAFFSTIIIVASFLPVFLLTGQEGKLFSPLAWTKTFILIIDAFALPLPKN